MMNRGLISSVLCISLVAEVYLLLHFSSVLLAWMFLIGKSDCSFQKTLDVLRFESEYYSSRERAARLSHFERQEEGMELWWTPRGEFWVPRDGGPLRFGVLAEQDLKIYGTGASGVRRGDVVLDCGSDVGMFTRSALEMGATLVVAIDPATVVQPCLRLNFHREIASGRVIIYTKGVWNKVQTMSMYGNSVIMHYWPAGDVIQLTTIDNLVEELKLSGVDFIKMDIEGAEKQALEGARRTLARFKPRLAISCEHFQSDAREIPELVRAIVPDYVVECGPCVHWADRFQPFVLNFH